LESKLCSTTLPQMQQLLHQTLWQVAVHLNLSHCPPSLTCIITDINTQQHCCHNIVITIKFCESGCLIQHLLLVFFLSVLIMLLIKSTTPNPALLKECCVESEVTELHGETVAHSSSVFAFCLMQQ
jgi:hypothetical protein